MDINHNRATKSVARTAIVAMATGLAALAFASPASAESKTVLDQHVGVDNCGGGNECGRPQLLHFATTGSPTLKVTFTGDLGHCTNHSIVPLIALDGQPQPPGDPVGSGQSTGFETFLPEMPGDHTVAVDVRGRACVGNGWHGHLRIDEVFSEPVPEQGQMNPPPPPPVTNAITLSFGQPQITVFPPGARITATVRNSSDLPGNCTYDASGLVDTHRDFNIAPKGSTDLTFNGLATGTNYHAKVSCLDASGKQTQPIGTAERDVRF